MICKNWSKTPVQQIRVCMHQNLTSHSKSSSSQKIHEKNSLHVCTMKGHHLQNPYKIQHWSGTSVQKYQNILLVCSQQNGHGFATCKNTHVKTLIKCANSLGLQLQSDVAREFPHKGDLGFNIEFSENSLKSFSDPCQATCKTSSLSCAHNSTVWLSTWNLYIYIVVSLQHYL
jgi:hypothetical protein